MKIVLVFLITPRGQGDRTRNQFEHTLSQKDQSYQKCGIIFKNYLEYITLKILPILIPSSSLPFVVAILTVTPDATYCNSCTVIPKNVVLQMNSIT